MKKITIGIVALMLILTGCSSKVKPEDTVDTFFTAVKKLDLEGAKKTLLPEVIEELEGQFNEATDELVDTDDSEDELVYEDLEGFTEAKAVIKDYLSELEYEVGEAVITGDNEDLASVAVEVTYVNAGEVFTNTFTETLGRMFGMAFTGKEMDETEMSEVALEIFNKQAEEYEVVKASKDITLNLTKKDNKWFINELDEETLNVLLFGIQDSFDSWSDGLFGE